MHSTALPPAPPAPPVLLAELTWPEVRERARTGPVVLLPLGAFEQHGPGMTLATDTQLVAELCRRAATRLSPGVLVAPPLPWGLSDAHLGFPGTISLHPETFYALIRDVIASLLGHGLRRVLLVNGHGGNQAASELACVRLRRELAVELVGTVTYATLAGVEATELSHAGALETSVALALAPEVVKLERLVPAALREAGPDLAPVMIPRAVHEVSGTGHLGDPRAASVERGQALVEGVLDRLCALITTFSTDAAAFAPGVPDTAPGEGDESVPCRGA
jgi:creatinine amidohydrolase